METMRWGIIGPGRIARKFSDALRSMDDAVLVGVAPRELGRAQAFASEYEAPLAFDSVEALAASDEIDAIYVATPHPFHADATRICIETGKPVLCEKPFTDNGCLARCVESPLSARGVDPQ